MASPEDLFQQQQGIELVQTADGDVVPAGGVHLSPEPIMSAEPKASAAATRSADATSPPADDDVEQQTPGGEADPGPSMRPGHLVDGLPVDPNPFASKPAPTGGFARPPSSKNSAAY